MSIPVRSSPTGIIQREDSPEQFLPLSISLAVSSSSLASNTYNGEETDLFIPPGPSGSNNNRFNIPRYPNRTWIQRELNYRETSTSPGSMNGQIETDPGVLARRQKQIDYGKNTEEYGNYLKAVPINERGPGHPKTPPMHRKYSRRAWDGLIKRWRLNLHCWTYPEAVDDNGNYNIFGLKELSQNQKRHNESFNSGTTDTTSRSVSTDSSTGTSLSRGFESRDYSRRLAAARNHHLEVEQREFKLFSPPNTRPSSSLCFSEYRDRDGTSSGTYRISRQSTSDQDLTGLTGSSTSRFSPTKPGVLNGNWWNDVNHNNNCCNNYNNIPGARNVESANEFFRYYLKH